MARRIKDLLMQALAAVERYVDSLVYTTRDRMGLTRPPVLLPYRSHGQGGKLHLRTRVVEDLGLTPAEHHDSYFQNALGMFRRFKTFDLPGARVRFSLGDASCEAVADEEGHVFATLEVPPLPRDQLWHEVKAELIWSPRHPEGTEATAILPVLVPRPEAEFCVISDVDDTVLQTEATSFIRMLRTTLLRNAYTRLPFEGVGAFYKALSMGNQLLPTNPVFYVSSSPWNLYDLLQDFFYIEGLPPGPLFLRDFGIDREKFIIGSHGSHKREAIDELLATHPGIPFLLIGDSGQEDAAIYAGVARDHPERVLAIYIRDVTTGRRDRELHALAESLKPTGVEMLLVKDSMKAAEDAVRRGLIPASALPSVAAAKRRDLAAE